MLTIVSLNLDIISELSCVYYIVKHFSIHQKPRWSKGMTTFKQIACGISVGLSQI